MKRQRELDPRGRTTSKNCGPLARDFFWDNENRLFYNFKNKLATFRKLFWTLINIRTFTNKCIYSAYEWNNKSGDAFWIIVNKKK